MRNRSGMNLKYIIWGQKIWHPSVDAVMSWTSWRTMEDRGSITQNHWYVETHPRASHAHDEQGLTKHFNTQGPRPRQLQLNRRLVLSGDGGGGGHDENRAVSPSPAALPDLLLQQGLG